MRYNTEQLLKWFHDTFPTADKFDRYLAATIVEEHQVDRNQLERIGVRYPLVAAWVLAQDEAEADV